MGKKCEACRENPARYNVANLHLCKKCEKVAMQDIRGNQKGLQKIKKLITKRQEKKIDQALSEISDEGVV